MTANKYTISFWGDKNVLELVMTAHFCEHTKTSLYILKGEFYGM